MAAGRYLGPDRGARRPWREIAACVALAWLPDADVIGLALGVPDRGLFGHRGLTHTPVFALGVGLAVGAWRWRRERAGAGAPRSPRRGLRAGLAAFLLVASHGVLDGIALDGRGILYLWPFSLERFHLPWRFIPDAPLPWKFFTSSGLSHLALEFCLFLPFTIFALRRRARAGRPTPVPARLRLPTGAAPAGS